MTDRPILFSGAMVRALLDGRKSQTRRVLKPSSNVGNFPMYPAYVNGVRAGDSSPPDYCALDGATTDGSTIYMGNSPYCPGDRLWVRETFARIPVTAYALPKTVDPSDPDVAAHYRADFDRSGNPGWKPAIHMPRWASRLTLTVTDVRVQRLQEISEQDALAEGMDFEAFKSGDAKGKDAVSSYAILWDSLNAKRGRGFGWEANPWVVAVTFSVERRNIDQVARHG